MRILISGSTGLIGSAAVAALAADGHEIVRLVRGSARPGALAWDPEAGRIDAAALEGFDAVVHLAGESIAGGRWTAERKRRIRDSRVAGTELLAGALAQAKARPSVLVAASAIGFYGNRGSEELDEGSAMGEGFLAEVCRDWEASTRAALRAGIRVAHLRFGIVLSAKGGALAKMLLPFRLGLGGRVGDGRQWMSFVALDDAVAALRFALGHAGASGPLNVVAPEPVTNAEFARALGRVLHRPAVVPLPAFALRLALGEMADALLLSGARVLPRRLLAAGFRFRCPSADAALRAALGR